MLEPHNSIFHLPKSNLPSLREKRIFSSLGFGRKSTGSEGGGGGGASLVPPVNVFRLAKKLFHTIFFQ